MYQPGTASLILIFNYIIQITATITIGYCLLQILRKKLTASPDNITLFLAMPLFIIITSHLYLSFNLPAIMKSKISQTWNWENQGLMHTLVIDTENKRYILYRQTAIQTQLDKMNNHIKFTDTLSGATSEFTVATETEPTILQNYCIYLYEFPADHGYVTHVEMKGPFSPTLYLGQNESIPLH